MSIGSGRPVVGDLCMGSALHVNGTPYAHAATEDAKAIERVTRQKQNEYPELIASDRIRYVVLACEKGGRWGPDVFEVVSDLVRLKVSASPPAAPPLGRARVYTLHAARKHSVPAARFLREVELEKTSSHARELLNETQCLFRNKAVSLKSQSSKIKWLQPLSGISIKHRMFRVFAPSP